MRIRVLHKVEIWWCAKTESSMSFCTVECGGRMWSLTAWGEKLLLSLALRQRMLLYLLSHGSRMKRLGQVSSFGILWTDLTSLMSLPLDRCVAIMFLAVFITYAWGPALVPMPVCTQSNKVPLGPLHNWLSQTFTKTWSASRIKLIKYAQNLKVAPVQTPTAAQYSLK